MSSAVGDVSPMPTLTMRIHAMAIWVMNVRFMGASFVALAPGLVCGWDGKVRESGLLVASVLVGCARRELDSEGQRGAALGEKQDREESGAHQK